VHQLNIDANPVAQGAVPSKIEVFARGRGGAVALRGARREDVPGEVFER